MDDLIKRLDNVANFKNGEIVDGFGPGEWSATISKLCADASAEITRLRAQCFGQNARLDQLHSIVGCAMAEPLVSFADIKKGIHNGKDAQGQP